MMSSAYLWNSITLMAEGFQIRITSTILWNFGRGSIWILIHFGTIGDHVGDEPSKLLGGEAGMQSITARIYNQAFSDSNLSVVKVDVLPVEEGEAISLTFEGKNSAWKQGVRLLADGGLLVEGKYLRAGALLWYETAPPTVHIRCFAKNGLLVLYNVWDRGIGVNSQAYTSGMVVEEIELGRRYRCNDIGFNPQFDKLIFRVERE
jgi:hypothetical protein